MSEHQYGEKYEKEEEKAEKEHEKEEKTWDEKWRRDPLSGIVWATILIWAGVVFCASSRITNALLRLRPRMNASGSTSIVWLSRYRLRRSGGIIS